MGRVPVRLLAVICALLLAALALPTQAATPTEQARLIQLTNDARAAQGLAPVLGNSALTTSAESYASYMATSNFFSHTGLNGSTMQSRDEAAGYTSWTFLGENIAAGQTIADAVFQAWMNSAGHRANILDSRAREIGIGHAYTTTSTYGHYWTMELGNRPGASSAPAATPTPQPTSTPVQTYRLPAAGRYRLDLPLASH